MALVTNDFYTISATLQDRDGNKADVSFKTVVVADLTDLIDDIPGTFVPLLQALTDAVVVGWSVSLGAVDTAPATPAEASDVERKGVFTFRDAAGRPMTVQVPSVLNTLVVDGTTSLDRAAAAVSNFYNAVVNGTLFGAISVVSAAGNDITRFVDAYKRHRASRRG